MALLQPKLKQKPRWSPKLNETDARARIKQLALRLLAQREQSAFELLHKLRARGATDELAEQVVAELQALGLQDERRFAESFVRARYERGIGPVRIRLELKAKGIASELVDQVLAELALDWEQAAWEVYRRKYKGQPVSTLKEYGKRYRFLVQRGFEAEHIRALLK